VRHIGSGTIDIPPTVRYRLTAVGTAAVGFWGGQPRRRGVNCHHQPWLLLLLLLLV
jgi:hypothetical protein